VQVVAGLHVNDVVAKAGALQLRLAAAHVPIRRGRGQHHDLLEAAALGFGHQRRDHFVRVRDIGRHGDERAIHPNEGLLDALAALEVQVGPGDRPTIAGLPFLCRCSSDTQSLVEEDVHEDGADVLRAGYHQMTFAALCCVHATPASITSVDLFTRGGGDKSGDSPRGKKKKKKKTKIK